MQKNHDEDFKYVCTLHGVAFKDKCPRCDAIERAEAQFQSSFWESGIVMAIFVIILSVGLTWIIYHFL